MVSRVSSFKNRKLIAEGIFMSKLTYLIPLWGGCCKYLLKALQVIQNRAARTVTRLGWDTATKDLLRQCGWLSVHQLAFYHSVLLVYKVVQNKSPQYLASMFDTPYQYPTRQADSGIIKHVGAPGSELVRKSFRWRASEEYNLLPAEIRTSSKLLDFKKSAKKWIMENVEI